MGLLLQRFEKEALLSSFSGFLRSEVFSRVVRSVQRENARSHRSENERLRVSRDYCIFRWSPFGKEKRRELLS